MSRRSRTPRRRLPFGGRWVETRETLGIGLFGFTLVASALALGSAHVYVALACAPLVIVGAGCLLHSAESRRWSIPAAAAFALSAYALIQAAPLPTTWVASLSASAGDVWSRALKPFGESIEWATLSLDPGATRVEALKWFLYGIALLSARQVAEQRGPHWCALGVYLSAVCVAIATLAHGLAGVNSVFGIYRPTFNAAAWHIGPFLNPNNLSAYLNLGAFCGLGLALSERLGQLRWLIASGCALILGVTILSGSRAGVAILPVQFAALAVVVFLMSRTPRSSRRHQAIVVGATMAGAALFGAIGATRATFQELAEQQVEKFQVLREVAPLVREHWLFGIGRGAFESVFPAYFSARGNAVYSHPENWVAQWASEWGVPVTLVLLALVFHGIFVGRRAVQRSSLAAGVAVGLGGVMLQNLADFGLEFPATALAVAVLLPCVQPPASSWSWSWSWSLPGITIVGFMLFASACLYGNTTVGMDRLALRAQCTGAPLANTEKAKACLTELRSTMIRHPAEPYFPRLGASLTFEHGGGDPLAWIQRALERNLNASRSHLLCARIVHSLNSLDQSLFHLRRATELEPEMAEQVGRLAARWAREPASIERAAPPGKVGARVLASAAQELSRVKERSVATQQVFEAALALDAKSVPALTAFAQYLLSHDVACSSRPDCQQRLLKTTNALMELTAGSATGPVLKARALAAAANFDGAAELLRTLCADMQGPERYSCVRERFAIERDRPDGSLKQLRSAGEELAQVGCQVPVSCYGVLLDIGDALAARNDWATAAAFYEKAGRESLSLDTLTRIARAATELGHLTRAQMALERADRLVAKDPERRKGLREWRERLQRQAAGLQ